MSNMSAWVDPFLKDLFRREETAGGKEERVFLPPADILESEESWMVLVDMPGVDEKGVEIQLEEGVLTITGRPPVEAREGFVRVLTERAAGFYRRRITLGENSVDADAIKAVIRQGVLRVTLPKSKGARAHRIPVQGESTTGGAS
jgi:HSP20 family protein